MKKKNVIAILAAMLILLCAGLGYFVWKHDKTAPANATPAVSDNTTSAESEDSATEVTNVVSKPAGASDTFQVAPEFESTLKKTGDTVLDEANRLAAMYSYEEAISKLKGQSGYDSNENYKKAVEAYEEANKKLVKWSDNTKVTHIFFHTLSVDVGKTFDTALCGENQVKAYNEVMTTVDEFVKIIQSMYDRGYVLVNLKDVAEMETAEDGTEQMKMQPIMLPEGKMPFVLSVDDVSYYEYMKGQGFATRLVIGDDGKVTNEMEMDDGSVIRGSFDVLPILEDFLEAHPDFSYRGAKGILALTGYEGVFGYRTSDFWFNWDCDYFQATDKNIAHREKYYYNNPNIEQDKQKAKEVAEAIKAQGWELASHSWGHRDMGTIEYNSFTWDVDMWEKEVRPILGEEVDTIIFPKGADIGSWKGYETGNERFEYLKSKGFDYYCNVDSSTYWVQIGANKDYFRMGRRNLDGTRMWEALQSYEVTDGSAKDRVSDLFDVKEVFDPARPTPVE